MPECPLRALLKEVGCLIVLEYTTLGIIFLTPSLLSLVEASQ